MPTVEEVCGPYPAASNYADSYVGADGSINYLPLKPDQTARYLAAVAQFQQCQAVVQGVPLCPVGQYFAGSLVDGVWLGHCVSDYTGQPTTPDTSIPVNDVPGAGPLTVPISTPTPTPTAPPVTTPTPTPPKPPTATPPKPSTPSSTPSPSASAAKFGAKYIGGPDPGQSSYCDLFPEDPFCDLIWPIGPPPVTTTVNNTTVIQQVGLLASDVHQAIDDGLKGLWGVLTGTLDIAFGSAIAAVQNAVTALGNALKAAWNILSRLSGLILQFLQHLWYAVLHGLVLAVQEIASAVKAVYNDILKPMLGWLLKLRQKILDIWKRFIVPVLIVIQDIRRVLNILALFHISWARKLDQKLGQLEAKITQPLIVVLGAINQVANWINLIATAGYFFQKPIFLASLKAYVGSVVRLQLGAMTKPIGAAQLATFQHNAVLPTAAQSSSAAVDYIQTGAGLNATIADQQRAALQSYLSNGF